MNYIYSTVSSRRLSLPVNFVSFLFVSTIFWYSYRVIVHTVYQIFYFSFQDYTPTGFDTYTSTYDVTDNYTINLSLWDTSG